MKVATLNQLIWSIMQQNTRTLAGRNHTQLFILLSDALGTPDAVSQQLGLVPTKTAIKGTPIQKKTGKGKARHQTLTRSAWVLSTHSLQLPNTCQAHVDWLLEQLAGKEERIRQLQSSGCWVGVTCFWYSTGGDARPTLAPATQRYLDDLQISIDFELERG
jgi:hypothetical protein